MVESARRGAQCERDLGDGCQHERYPLGSNVGTRANVNRIEAAHWRLPAIAEDIFTYFCGIWIPNTHRMPGRAASWRNSRFEAWFNQDQRR